MIVCTECGEHQGEDAVFCGRCGAFLEFEGERVESPDDTNTEVGTDLDADDEGPVEPPPNEGPAEEGVADAPAAATVATRQPDEARARPRGPAPRRIDRLPSGSLICGQCGTGNEPTRRFCLRCGQPLAGAAVVTRPPWWRRLLFRERTYVAGTRKRPRGAGKLVFRLLLLAALVTLVILLIGPWRSSIADAYGWVASKIAGPEQIRPAEVTASGAAPEAPVELAFDGANNTYWAAPAGAQAPSLQMTLPETVDLVAVGITPGTSVKTPEFLAGPRPEVIEISARTADGVQVQRFTLEPNPGFRELEVDLPGVREVTLIVVSAQGTVGGESAAISEVELFAAR